MQVSFIIPLYNCLAHTRECLRTLQATLPPGLAHEIIFVDDGSTDGTRDWLKTLAAPCRVILNEHNLGFAGACNRGATAARGEFLFFLNNDLIFFRRWFEPMRAAFDRFPAAALVGNLQLNAQSGALDHAGVVFDVKGKPTHDIARPLITRLTGYRRVAALTGACFGIRTAIWRDLGGFDEGFQNGGEDIDFALRARRAGLQSYVALRSIVRHHVSASVGRKLRDEQNSYRLAQRWRKEIAVLTAPAWCSDYLDREWQAPRDPAGFGYAFAAWFTSLGWCQPNRALLQSVDEALEQEFVRWRKLLDGTVPAKDSTAVRQA
jgi:O-antigen biosynthesis protein